MFNIYQRIFFHRLNFQFSSNTGWRVLLQTSHHSKTLPVSSSNTIPVKWKPNMLQRAHNHAQASIKTINPISLKSILRQKDLMDALRHQVTRKWWNYFPWARVSVQTLEFQKKISLFLLPSTKLIRFREKVHVPEEMIIRLCNRIVPNAA